MPKPTAFDRFVDKIKFDANEKGCWLWTAGTNGVYGQFSIKGSSRYAHRVSFTAFVCPIPEGWTIDHLCRNKLCVNPDHLEAVSFQTNLRRARGWTETWDGTWQCAYGHRIEDWNEMTIQKTDRTLVNCRECRNAGKRVRRG